MTPVGVKATLANGNLAMRTILKAGDALNTAGIVTFDPISREKCPPAELGRFEGQAMKVIAKHAKDHDRKAFVARSRQNLPLPEIHVIERAKRPADSTPLEIARLKELLITAKAHSDFIIIDTPGSDTELSRLGHSAADTLLTPINDSFLDFDLLAKCDAESLESGRPSLYSEFVWDCRKRRLMADRKHPNIEWVVMRNRVSSVEARNKRKVAAAIEKVSSRIGCRIAAGLSERVIFRELFPLGLTVLDLPVAGLAMPLTMSHIAARQEVRALLSALRLPGLERESGDG